MREDRVVCNKCDGVGEVIPRDSHFGTDVCPKCKGKGSLDWIENIMGLKGTYIKAGVYTQEVDYSIMIKEVKNVKSC